MKKILSIFLIVLIVFILTGCNQTNTDNGELRITTSFYPMYIISLNITKGANNIILENMTDTSVGCLHNYSLTTNDLKKAQESDILIINGLGLEENVLNTINKTNSSIQIINSSENIDESDIIKEDESNPHIWTSISLYKKQVEKISEDLINLNPENSEIYEKNTIEYIGKLDELESKANELKAQIQDLKVVVFSESVEYLIRDMDIKYYSLHMGHEDSGVSTENLRNIIDEINEKNIKAIIIDNEDSKAIANSVSEETGASIYELDSGLTGEINLDSYIEKMESNLEVLRNIILEGNEM